jgi:hypothetical protein
MRHHVRRLVSGLAAVVAGLTMIAGCGPAEPEQLAAEPVSGTALTASLETDTAALARFWAVDRFVFDDHRPVKVERLMQPPELLAKAEPDEVFQDQPKTNDAYVWGLVQAGKSLWFGTVANTLCYAQQDIVGAGLDLPVEDMTGYWYCGFGLVDGHYGDWRAPNLYRYDLAAGQLESVNPGDGDAEALRQQTIGFRSAGSSRGVVFLAGPSLDGAIVMFAYDADTFALLGAKKMPAYNNVRSWVNAANDLYVGVGLVQPVLPSAKAAKGTYPVTDFHGAVLRWMGSKADPFKFEVVGYLQTEAANLALHENQIYVTTWPFFLTSDLAAMHPMSLYRSPKITKGGLTGASAMSWERMWGIGDYDRDPLASLATGGGAIASYGGRIYWGTMHVPFAATAMALQAYRIDLGKIDAALVERLANIALGSHRSPAVFHGKATGSDRHSHFEVTMLYGEKYLPRAGADGIYRVAPTRNFATGYKPAFGASGLGNFFNAYIWSASTFQDNLWLGTFDWSQLARVGLQTILMDENVPGSDKIELLHLAAEQLVARTGNIVPHEGADLYRFHGSHRPAVAEDLGGLGNDTNYGIRTMVPGHGAFYIGTANAMNMHPDGGWELIQLRPQQDCDRDHDDDEDPDDDEDHDD